MLPRGTACRTICQSIRPNRYQLSCGQQIVTALRRHVRRLHAFLTDEVEALQTAGTVRGDEPADALAWLLISVAVGFGMVAPITPAAHASPGGREWMQRLLAELLAG